MEQENKEVVIAQPEPKVQMVQQVEIKKIQFKNLSAWLKLAVVMSWITGAFYVLAFLYGVLIGMTTPI